MAAFRAFYTSIKQWIRQQALSFKDIANKPNGKLLSQQNIDTISVNTYDLKFIITEKGSKMAELPSLSLSSF